MFMPKKQFSHDVTAYKCAAMCSLLYANEGGWAFARYLFEELGLDVTHELSNWASKNEALAAVVMEYKVNARGNTRRRKLRHGRKQQTADAYREKLKELKAALDAPATSSSSSSAAAVAEELESEVSSDGDYDSEIDMDEAIERAAIIDIALQANDEQYASRYVKRRGGFDMLNGDH